MVQVANLFSTTSETVSDFFRRPGAGYYIPLYQREYSWDRENINQLMDDIMRGVDALLNKEDAIHFLGTIILVTERNRNAIQPQDSRALPTRVDNVIDGQQRLSTIAMLSCLLYDRIRYFTKSLPTESPYDGLHEAAKGYLKLLIEVFSVDLGRGTPERKPIIIRGSIDTWTLDGHDTHYESEVSHFLATSIRATFADKALSLPQKKSMVTTNIQQMNRRLKEIETSYEQDNESFPSAQRILAAMSQDDLWNYERPELAALINSFGEPMDTTQKQVCSLVQLFAFCHYLLRGCCFTSIEPTMEDRAFDMFQSLNATGTPLTALETFKPLVVNTAKTQDGGFKDSQLEEAFGHVDTLFGSVRSASDKSKLTNEYLTTFAVAHKGEKLARQFSAQRRWLNREYSTCSTREQREEFVRRMSELAMYWDRVIYFEPKHASALPGTDNVAAADRYLAALCVMYLEDANHKMAHAVLSRFYSLVLREQSGADTMFVQACKAVAAFFTLWRSALPNTGLDDIYRKLLFDHMSWEKCKTALDINALKAHLRTALNDPRRAIGSKENWKPKAIQYLRYDNARQVCRFALFVTAHDAIPDLNEPGLMIPGSTGYCTYLTPERWREQELKDIEHVAPQTASQGGNWDPALYEEDNYQLIGNLTLLPTAINISAGNQGWIAKWIYYRHLAETDPAKFPDLANEAQTYGVNLASPTLDKLKKATHAHHIAPLVQLGASGDWNKALVDKRTERICDILWERMYEWLT
jgi:hypothetical protein